MSDYKGYGNLGDILLKNEGRISGIESSIRGLATKEDVEKLKTSILYWLVPTIITAIGVTVGLVTVVCGKS